MVLVVESALVKVGEEVYEENREEWERRYLGKIVAIEVESRRLAGIGDTLEEAYEEAVKRFPGKKFYFRRVGPCPAPTYLF